MADQYVSIVPLSALIKVYRSEEDYLLKKQYKSIIGMTYSSESEVTLAGARGKMSIDTIVSVAEALIKEGVTTVYLDRADDHVFPFGEVVSKKEGLTRYKIDLANGLDATRHHKV